MRNFLKHPFIFSLIFIAISFALPKDVNGQPRIRKEAGDGGHGGPLNCLVANGEDGYLYYLVEIDDLDDMPDCNLFIVISKNGTEEYLPISADSLTFNGMVGSYDYRFKVHFTAAEIAAICDRESEFSFNIGFACQMENGYEHLVNPNGSGPGSINYPTCCPIYPTHDEEEEPDTVNVDPGYRQYPSISITSNKIYEQIRKPNNTDLNYNSYYRTCDYYIYDIQGNQIMSLKGRSIDNNLHEVISGLDIRAGIYFVRYLQNNTYKTEKVIKF